MGLIYLDAAYRASEAAAVCLGTFDGVHLGHMALIRATSEAARQKGLVPTAFTFDKPPFIFFHPECAGDMLSTVSEKAQIMMKSGIRDVICCPFTQEICDMTYQDFFRDILLKQCRAEALIVGFHFTFGKKALGNAASLKPLCEAYGIDLTVIPPVTTDDGQLISSTAIRQYLKQGDRANAEKMLGHTI